MDYRLQRVLPGAYSRGAPGYRTAPWTPWERGLPARFVPQAAILAAPVTFAGTLVPAIWDRIPTATGHSPHPGSGTTLVFLGVVIDGDGRSTRSSHRRPPTTRGQGGEACSQSSTSRMRRAMSW